mgnify:CR=1 FL=1
MRRGLSPRGRASRLPRKSRTRGRAGGKNAWRRVASRTKTRLRRFAIRVVEHEDFEALVDFFGSFSADYFASDY